MAANENICDGCEYKEQVAALRAELAELKRHVFGQRSERMPSISEELKSKKTTPDRRTALKKRRDNQAAKDELVEEHFDYNIDKQAKHCPKCNGTSFSKLGPGKQSVVFEYIPGKLIKQVHVQETLICSCGEHIVTAEGPQKVVEQGRYGPGFMAHIALRKCGDQTPIYRLEKDFKRLGIPVARSTMNDLFHRAAKTTQPLSKRLLEIIASSEIVTADETPVKIQAKKKCKRGYAWTFTAHPDDAPDKTLVGYRFSKNRSSKTPCDVLGSSKGTLVVDAYTGYNKVTQPEGRKRCGCLAHARRKFFDALPTAPAAREAMDQILDAYRVEHEALETGILQSQKHAELRNQRSRSIMDKLNSWLLDQQGLHPPRSPIGKAISYALNNWPSLTLFLDDVRLPLDNNMSERQLRPIAIGRKNWLFVGDEQLGQNLCGLQALISTCEVNGVNPWEYMKDVLARINEHPMRDLDELLPHRWQAQVT